MDVSYPWLSDWTRLQCALHSYSTLSRRVHSLCEGGYAALHKLLWWHWGDRTYCLIFC